MASTRHNADFANHLLPSDPLDTAIDWIKANLSPGDVFDVTWKAGPMTTAARKSSR